jgi:hypothetical protein
MMKRMLVLVAMLAMLVLSAAPAALALSCDNVSRAAPKGDVSSGPIIKGHWVWLPSIGIDEEVWGFVPPGTEPGEFIGKPHGNFTNGKTHSLLGVSAQCDPSKTTSRQTDHGVQTGCV